MIRRIVNSPRRLLVVYVAIFVVLSELYAFIEHKGPIEGLWWAIVSGSTVGYGDSYPVTTAGRAVAMLLIVISVAFVAMAGAHMTNHLLTDPDAWRDEEQEELKRNVNLILENQETIGQSLSLILDSLILLVPNEETPENGK